MLITNNNVYLQLCSGPSLEKNELLKTNYNWFFSSKVKHQKGVLYERNKDPHKLASSVITLMESQVTDAVQTSKAQTIQTVSPFGLSISSQIYWRAVEKQSRNEKRQFSHEIFFTEAYCD